MNFRCAAVVAVFVVADLAVWLVVAIALAAPSKAPCAPAPLAEPPPQGPSLEPVLALKRPDAKVRYSRQMDANERRCMRRNVPVTRDISAKPDLGKTMSGEEQVGQLLFYLLIHKSNGQDHSRIANEDTITASM